MSGGVKGNTIPEEKRLQFYDIKNKIERFAIYKEDVLWLIAELESAWEKREDGPNGNNERVEGHPPT